MEDRIQVVDVTPNDVVNDSVNVTVDATRHNPAVRLAKGFYQKWRRAIAIPLIGLFLFSPWLSLNDAPLLWMDLSTRELHLMGLTFWPDDLLMVTWLGFASAFGLFAVSTFAGRLWCGFACPQTVWTMMFTWVEEKVQGSRNQRLKEQNKSLKDKQLSKLIIKHGLWWLIAFITGFTFVAFFETGEGLALQLLTGSASVSTWFWLLFFSSLTYINGGWLREQVCMHMCPYARFQSVMLDRKSLKVTYDDQRGEPRTAKGKSHSRSALESEPKGDCVDCNLCVQVCPVGIDIRDGLQYSCIDCAACIDACDDIMVKLGRPKGLIKFDSAHLNKNWRLKELFTGRGKLWGYSALTLLFSLAFVLQVIYRETLDVHFERDRGQLYFYNGNGQLANGYRLKLHNKTDQDAMYEISVKHPLLSVSNGKTILISAGERRTVPVEVQCLGQCDLPSRNTVELNILDKQSNHSWQIANQYFVPQ